MQVISTTSELKQINGAANGFNRFNNALSAGLEAAQGAATHPFTYAALGFVAFAGYVYGLYTYTPSSRRR